jgi:hypothetical protein
MRKKSLLSLSAPWLQTSARIYQSVWVPLTLCLIAFIGLGSAAILHGSVMSVFDEWVYLDYLYKVPTQGMVFKGEFIGTQALQLMACTGQVPYGVMGGACDGNFVPGVFPNGGITTADPFTPLYFVLTWLGGAFFNVIPGLGQIAAWRLANVLWLCAGLVAFYKLGKQWRVPNLAIFTVGILIIGSPIAYWSWTYISTDSPSFFFGAILLYFATRFTRGQGGGYWIVGLSVIATLFKVTNILAVCMVALFLGITWLTTVFRRSPDGPSLSELSRPKPQKMLLVIAGVSLVTSMLAEVGWLKLHDLLAVTTASVDQGISVTLTWFELLRLTKLTTGTLPLTIPVNGIPGLSTLPLPDYIVLPLSWILIAGVLAALWTMSKGDSRNPLIITAFVATVGFGPLLALALQLMTSSYFTLPPRYMIPILAIALLSVAFTLKNRAVMWILVSYGLILLLGLIAASWVISMVDLPR